MDVDIGKETIYNAFFVRDDKYKDLFCSAEAIFFDEFTLSGIPPTIIDAIKDFLIYAYDTKKRLFISSNHPIKEVTQRFINESLVVSKNMSGEVVDKRQMEKLVAERLESRLNEMLVEYEITGNDYRNTLADQRKKDIEERLKK
jgi:hypothetical protein